MNGCVSALPLPCSAEGVDDGAAPCSVTRVESCDIDEQAASLREWDQVYAQLTPGRFIGELHEASFRGVQIFRETTNQSVHEAGRACSGTLAIGIPVRMSASGLLRGESFDTNAMIALGVEEELDLYTPAGFEILGLAVNWRVLCEYAMSVECRDAMALFDRKSVLRPPAERLACLRRLLASVLEALDVNPAALQYHQAQRLLEQSVLGALLAVLADADESSASGLPSSGRQRLVDAARAYMNAHIDETITVADLCVKLNVSRRTLQYAFNDVLNLNPVRFLRALRLNGVRRELRAAAAASACVQDVAAKWGFWHLGHFVTDYKRMFGELPSETLRRKGAPLTR